MFTRKYFPKIQMNCNCYKWSSLSRLFACLVLALGVALFLGSMLYAAPMESNSDASMLVNFASHHSDGIRVLQAEYIVENANEDGGWHLSERRRVTYDFVNNYFKQEVIKPPRNGKAFLQYDVSSWDGDRTVTISRQISYNDEFKFANDYAGIPVGAISAAPLVRVDPFVNFYQGYFENQTLKDYLEQGIDGKRSLDINSKNGKTISITVNNNLVFNVASNNGAILSRTSLVGGGDGKSVKSTETIVEDSQLIDGLFYPLRMVYTEMSSEGVASLRQRISLVKDSIRLNAAIPKSTFTVNVPVGAKINDSITKTVYTVTGVDEQLGASEALINQLNKLIE